MKWTIYKKESPKMGVSLSRPSMRFWIRLVQFPFLSPYLEPLCFYQSELFCLGSFLRQTVNFGLVKEKR